MSDRVPPRPAQQMHHPASTADDLHLHRWQPVIRYTPQGYGFITGYRCVREGCDATTSPFHFSGRAVEFTSNLEAAARYIRERYGRQGGWAAWGGTGYRRPTERRRMRQRVRLAREWLARKVAPWL